MKYLFVRCNGGHYFRTTNACPWDGWSCDGIERARVIFDELGAAADTDRMRERGVPDSLIARLMIAEFGADASAFEALAPERFVHRGAEVIAQKADTTLF